MPRRRLILNFAREGLGSKGNPRVYDRIGPKLSDSLFRIPNLVNNPVTTGPQADTTNLFCPGSQCSGQAVH